MNCHNQSNRTMSRFRFRLPLMYNVIDGLLQHSCLGERTTRFLEHTSEEEAATDGTRSLKTWSQIEGRWWQRHSGFSVYGSHEAHVTLARSRSSVLLGFKSFIEALELGSGQGSLGRTQQMAPTIIRTLNVFQLWKVLLSLLDYSSQKTNGITEHASFNVRFSECIPQIPILISRLPFLQPQSFTARGSTHYVVACFQSINQQQNQQNQSCLNNVRQLWEDSSRKMNYNLYQIILSSSFGRYSYNQWRVPGTKLRVLLYLPKPIQVNRTDIKLQQAC